MPLSARARSMLSVPILRSCGIVLLSGARVHHHSTFLPLRPRKAAGQPSPAHPRSVSILRERRIEGSSVHETPVDQRRLTGHVVGIGPGQEGDERRDIFRRLRST